MTVEQTLNPRSNCYLLSDRVNGFNLWFEDSKGAFSEENPELSDSDLVKLAMRQWKALEDDEKMDWNKKAKEVTGEITEQGDKKRKREKFDDENEDTSNTLKLAKKTKEAVVNGATSKLAGFAYKKD